MMQPRLTPDCHAREGGHPASLLALTRTIAGSSAGADEDIERTAPA
jgi:hypothetical protein